MSNRYYLPQGRGKLSGGGKYPTGARGPDNLPKTFTEDDPPYTMAGLPGGKEPFKPLGPVVKIATRAQGAYTGNEK